MSDTVKQPETLDDIRTLLWEQYGGENKRIRLNCPVASKPR